MLEGKVVDGIEGGERFGGERGGVTVADLDINYRMAMSYWSPYFDAA